MCLTLASGASGIAFSRSPRVQRRRCGWPLSKTEDATAEPPRASRRARTPWPGERLAQAAVMAETEGRWAHLLQPIRELGANWDVDIAADLSDYLAELEQVVFTFDGGHTALNFAEGEPAKRSCLYMKCLPGSASVTCSTLIRSLAIEWTDPRSRHGHSGQCVRVLPQSRAPAPTRLPGPARRRGFQAVRKGCMRSSAATGMLKTAGKV